MIMKCVHKKKLFKTRYIYSCDQSYLRLLREYLFHGNANVYWMTFCFMIYSIMTCQHFVQAVTSVLIWLLITRLRTCLFLSIVVWNKPCRWHTQRRNDARRLWVYLITCMFIAAIALLVSLDAEINFEKFGDNRATDDSVTSITSHPS